MRRFLTKILWFSLPILALLTIFEVYVEHQPNISRYKHQWMLHHSHEVETLILGHSHNLYGLRPDLMGKGTFSLALSSQTYRYDCYLLKRYPMPKLKTLILNYDYFQPWEDCEETDFWFQAIRYRIYMDCDIHPRLSRYGFEFCSREVVQHQVQCFLRGSHERWDSLGWGTEFTIENRDEAWDNGEERATEQTYHDPRLFQLNQGFLREILDFCRAHHVQVILLNTPTTASFRQHEDPRQVRMNQQLLQDIQRTYPEVLYLNLEADPRFTPDDFYDADHLNHGGARKMTEIVLESYREVIGTIP